MTYRWYDHAGFAGGRVGQDGAMGLPYRTDEEVKQWMSRDPITRYKNWLLAKGLATEAELAEDRHRRRRRPSTRRSSSRARAPIPIRKPAC